MVQEGDRAPDFHLPGIDGNGNEAEFDLGAFLKQGRKLVLYFYPKDSTPGCTMEACDFRDNFNRIGKGATVVGVSPDSLASHQEFRQQQGLNFPLLSDTDRHVMEAYGAWGEKKMYAKTVVGVIRSTFIIDSGGNILRAWRQVKAKGHVDQVIEALDD